MTKIHLELNVLLRSIGFQVRSQFLALRSVLIRDYVTISSLLVFMVQKSHFFTLLPVITIEYFLLQTLLKITPFNTILQIILKESFKVYNMLPQQCRDLKVCVLFFMVEMCGMIIC